MSLTVREIEQVTEILRNLFDEYFGTGTPPDPVVVEPSMIGTAFDFEKEAQEFIDLKGFEPGSLVLAAKRALPTRLVWYHADNTPEEKALLEAHADYLVTQPGWYAGAYGRGYPVVLLNDLDGNTIPDVLAVIPVNRQAARNNSMITERRARIRADRWVNGEMSDAWLADQDNEGDE